MKWFITLFDLLWQWKKIAPYILNICTTTKIKNKYNPVPLLISFWRKFYEFNTDSVYNVKHILYHINKTIIWIDWKKTCWIFFAILSLYWIWYSLPVILVSTKDGYINSSFITNSIDILPCRKNLKILFEFLKVLVYV